MFVFFVVLFIMVDLFDVLLPCSSGTMLVDDMAYVLYGCLGGGLVIVVLLLVVWVGVRWY